LFALGFFLYGIGPIPPTRGGGQVHVLSAAIELAIVDMTMHALRGRDAIAEQVA